MPRQVRPLLPLQHLENQRETRRKAKEKANVEATVVSQRDLNLLDEDSTANNAIQAKRKAHATNGKTLENAQGRMMAHANLAIPTDRARRVEDEEIAEAEAQDAHHAVVHLDATHLLGVLRTSHVDSLSKALAPKVTIVVSNILKAKATVMQLLQKIQGAKKATTPSGIIARQINQKNRSKGFR